jgi:hypothetical protein
MRSAMPDRGKKKFACFMLDLSKPNYDVFDSIARVESIGHAPVAMDLYKNIIELCEAERRGSHS